MCGVQCGGSGARLRNILWREIASISTVDIFSRYFLYSDENSSYHIKMLLSLTILLLFPLTASAGDGWDDFANNLATDLAPILQLFGEQVTKQYLSESTNILDNIIFAMAPLG